MGNGAGTPVFLHVFTRVYTHRSISSSLRRLQLPRSVPNRHVSQIADYSGVHMLIYLQGAGWTTIMPMLLMPIREFSLLCNGGV